MRSAFVTDIARSIRGSLGRFLAIMGIVALGCGFYAGLQMCGPDMRADADALYDGTNLWDIRLISTLGFSDDDADRVRAVEGVKAVMPSLTCDAMARLGSEQVAVRITSLDTAAAEASAKDGLYAISSQDEAYLNRPQLVKGRWPRDRGECVISADVPRDDFGLGGVVELLYGTSDLDDLLSVDSLTVVGTVTSSNYPYTGSFGSTTLGSGMVDQYLYVSDASLAEDAPYTELYLTVDGALEELSESDAYQEVVDATKARLEALAGELSETRRVDLRAEAQETLDEKWDEYEEEKAKAERELADAKAKLDDAAEELAKGERELADGERQYSEGRATYEANLVKAERELKNGEVELDRNQRTIDGKWVELEQGRQELENGRSAYEQGVSTFLAQVGAKSLNEARAKLEAGVAEADAGISQLEDAIAQIEGAPAQAQAGVDQAEAAIAQCEGGIVQAEAALAQMPARAELEQQDQALTQGIAQLEQAIEAAGPEERAALEAQLAQLQAQQGEVREALGMRDAVEGQLAMARAGLEQAQAGLAQAQEGMTQARAAQAQLPGLRDKLKEVRVARKQARTALDGLAELTAAHEELVRGQNAYDKGKAQLEDGQAQLDEGRRTLAASREKARTELAKAAEQLSDAAAELAEARTKLADGRAEYEDGLAEYEDGRAEADEEFADALAQLEDAQREIDELELPDIYALDRTQSEGAATYHADAGRIDSIADVFPFVFFLVAALVSLTTMTRMVEDDRVQIGTYKALGYGTGAIAVKYLAYAGIAGVVGATVGIAALSQVLPFIVMSAYSIIYTVPLHPFPLPVSVPIALVSGGLGVGVTLLATWAAVVASLREVPATLMLPRAPKAGKRILLERVTPVWRRLSFTWKVTCRNLFRYKRRFLMTVIGISGCTALLLVGFGLHDAIWDIIDRQYGPIIHYDTTVGLDDNAIELDVRRVCDYLASTGEVTGIVRVQNENMQAGADGSDETIRVNVVIPRDASEVTGAITFRNRLSGEPLALDGDAVLVTEKLAIKYGLSAGDEIVLYDQDDVGNAIGEGHRLAITGVAENYVGNLVYMGRDAWARIDSGTPVFSTIYASTTADEAVRRGVTDALHDLEGVSTVIFSDETINMYRQMLSVVDMIVVVLIVSAAALAYIVLYNLTNINIGERIREIASLKVLGFTRGEVQSYIFREIALLAVMGDALGMLFGIFLERFVVTTAEVDYVMFGRSIHPPSFGYAFVLTLVFTGLVIATMRHKLDRVDMVESLKSVD